MSDLLVINGPNLNLLGTREPEHYGRDTLDSINIKLSHTAADNKLSIDFVQSNAEAELIECVHKAAKNNVRFIIINPAAFTHTSVALRDALSGVDIPFIEIHLSNVHAREAFREHSYFSDIAAGVITGLGALGYELALQAAIKQLKT
ncbi:MAG: type II 3-dehydroquinate dehydratase [Gammaproteobacteria bacterium]|jgi:3-dehydroquinate dehydratase-2|nr:type II 3-dehydroquinate dehydratase [Gammaproteobacteria bacterium]